MFRVAKRPQWQLYQYRVDVSPEEDMTKERKKLLRQHQDNLGMYMFDGTMLFTPTVYTGFNAQGHLIYTSKNDQGKMFTLTLRQVGVVNPMDMQYIQFYNIMIRKVMEKMNLTEVKRNYYDAENPIPIKQWKLELWLGYETSMRQHETETLLCCEISTKIIRTDTVLDQMKLCMKGSGGQEGCKRTLLGQIIMTKYNNKTYRIADIDFKKNPSDKFPRRFHAYKTRGEEVGQDRPSLFDPGNLQHDRPQ